MGWRVQGKDDSRLFSILKYKNRIETKVKRDGDFDHKRQSSERHISNSVPTPMPRGTATPLARLPPQQRSGSILAAQLIEVAR